MLWGFSFTAKTISIRKLRDNKSNVGGQVNECEWMNECEYTTQLMKYAKMQPISNWVDQTWAQQVARPHSAIFQLVALQIQLKVVMNEMS